MGRIFKFSYIKTPYELAFGQNPKILNSLNNPVQKPNYSNLAAEITSKLQTIREVARENQLKAKQKSKQTYDKTHNRQYTFKENDLVLLYNSSAKNTNKKLSKDFKGPYKIIQVHDYNTASIQLTKNKTQTYHFNLLKPYVSDDQPGPSKRDEDADVLSDDD